VADVSRYLLLAVIFVLAVMQNDPILLETTEKSYTLCCGGVTVALQ
jgi:hypothetical protein